MSDKGSERTPVDRAHLIPGNQEIRGRRDTASIRLYAGNNSRSIDYASSSVRQSPQHRFLHHFDDDQPRDNALLSSIVGHFMTSSTRHVI